MRKNRFESDWAIALVRIPQALGLAQSFEDPLAVMGEAVIATASGAAESAFDSGFTPDDAVLVGKTYLVTLLTQKYPTHVKPDGRPASLDDVMNALEAKYGMESIFKIRAITAGFANAQGLALHPPQEVAGELNATPTHLLSPEADSREVVVEAPALGIGSDHGPGVYGRAPRTGSPGHADESAPLSRGRRSCRRA